MEVATVIVLFIFAVLVWWGITDSANVALVMFIAHCGVLMMLIVASLMHVGREGGTTVRVGAHGSAGVAAGGVMACGSVCVA